MRKKINQKLISVENTLVKKSSTSSFPANQESMLSRIVFKWRKCLTRSGTRTPLFTLSAKESGPQLSPSFSRFLSTVFSRNHRKALDQWSGSCTSTSSGEVQVDWTPTIFEFQHQCWMVLQHTFHRHFWFRAICNFADRRIHEVLCELCSAFPNLLLHWR